MAGTIGAEMGQLQQLKTVFDREANNVQQLTSQITSQVTNTWWKGPAADRFRSQWQAEFAPTLRQLQQALLECSAEVQRRHDALQQAGS